MTYKDVEARYVQSSVKQLRNPLGFFIELMKQPIWIPIWVFCLMLVNIMSIDFWDDNLAKIIFSTFMLSAMLMMGLYSIFGFEKILGLGHILWFPLAVYIISEIPVASETFNNYLIVLLVFIAISLVFDTRDVWKYFTRYDREINID